MAMRWFRLLGFMKVCPLSLKHLSFQRDAIARIDTPLRRREVERATNSWMRDRLSRGRLFL
jgi:hypothetical protein